MHILRYSLLCTLFATGMQHTVAGSLFDNAAFQTELEALSAQGRNRFAELNGGHEINNFDAGLIKFIRTHAKEIGAEFSYLLDQKNSQFPLLLRYELDKLLQGFETFLKTTDLSSEQTLDVLLNKQATAMLLINCVGFLSATKQLIRNSLPHDACPILSSAWAQVDNVQGFYAELFKLVYKHAASATVPALAPEMADVCEDTLPTLKKVFDASFAYVQTEESKALLKNLIEAFVAFMQEDAFFEMLQFNNECAAQRQAYRLMIEDEDFDPSVQTMTPNRPKEFFMPATLSAFLEAGDLYGKAFSKALQPVITELFPPSFEIEFDGSENGYDADDEFSDCDCNCDCDIP